MIISSLSLVTLTLALILAGCGGPDTSAPERTVIKRSADWHGALLYIADRKGPDAEFGSVRIYDNVSGFVEKTVEQTDAAAPNDVLVTPDGGTMFVASSVNGKIDQFHWDGNNWIHGSVVETPSNQLFSLSLGPDGFIYAPGDSGGGAAKALVYRLNPKSLALDPAPVTFPSLESVHGISWSPDGGTAYVSGSGPGGKPKLLLASWPAGRVEAQMTLPGTDVANKDLTSPRGRFVYVMCRGEILKINPASRAVAGTLEPVPAASGNASINDYYGGALSADGRYLFAAGTPAGSDSTLYVIDLETAAVVKTVKHISAEARGLQRTE